jgi:hypothetical protein
VTTGFKAAPVSAAAEENALFAEAPRALAAREGRAAPAFLTESGNALTGAALATALGLVGGGYCLPELSERRSRRGPALRAS